MMKKVGILLLALLILNLFSGTLVKAQDAMPSELVTGVEKIQNISEQGKDTYGKLTDEEKRNYLFDEWKKIFMENKAFSIINSILTQFSFIFRIFLGEPYSISGILVIMVVLWFLLFFKISEILTDYSSFSPEVSLVMGLGITVIMAQLHMIRLLAELLVLLVFYKEGFLFRSIAFIVIVIVLAASYRLTSGWGEEYKKKIEKEKEMLEKMRFKMATENAEKYSKKVSEALGD